ncbi:hypothetical protein [Alistipes sp. ZOR0009]|jgi:hypothetical protein|uniref:hypothetical protein n=1 Tax=Alistipes sp. ZOR0009 TaxID=1339253 RepID=UPI00064707E4|nr:hypothetical protein [Alistipes sp. ZOR0009]
MEISKQKLDDLISAVEKIVEANSSQEHNLFPTLKSPENISEILEIPLQDPQKSYNLYYSNIQKFLGTFLPKDNEISKPIRELVCILLTGKEKSNLTYGTRGADSRMARTNDMENMIDVLSEWSSTPNEFFRLGIILLEKNKKLGYISEERTLQDYI